jgi:hypothetical protein
MAQPVSVVRRTPGSSGLYDVLDLILDKGLVIDAYVRVSVVGIELLTIDARIVVASVDTYLRFAEAVDRLQLQGQGKDLTDLTEGLSSGKTRGAIEGAKETVKDTFSRDDGGEKQKRRDRDRDRDEE